MRKNAFRFLKYFFLAYLSRSNSLFSGPGLLKYFLFQFHFSASEKLSWQRGSFFVGILASLIPKNEIKTAGLIFHSGRQPNQKAGNGMHGGAFSLQPHTAERVADKRLKKPEKSVLHTLWQLIFTFLMPILGICTNSYGVIPNIGV
jgi:hypothetical protein